MHLDILVFRSRSLSFFVFCNVQDLFYVILISCLCFSFPLLYLVNLYHVYVLIFFLFMFFFFIMFS